MLWKPPFVFVRGLVERIAALALKTEFAEMNRRITELEVRCGVTESSLQDSRNNVAQLETRIYAADLVAAKAEGALETVVRMLPQYVSNPPKTNSGDTTNDK